MLLPATSQQNLADDFLKGATSRTRVIFISHITSLTAMRFPVEEICRRARLAGILTVVDGAHAPGQIPLDLDELDADFYGGNLHKWLCAPKGAGFLYAKPDVQHLLEPLVVSWGYESETPSSSTFIDHHEWWGTRDVAAFLTVPAAIRFQRENNWDEVRAECHVALREALREIARIVDTPGLYREDSWYVQMASASLPSTTDVAAFQSQLYDQYRVEAPVQAWNEWKLARISIQGYNEPRDIERLLQAIQEMMEAARRD